MTPVSSSRLPAWIRGSGIIAISMAAMNIGTYGFTLLAARLLGPRDYGAVAALMGLALVLTVVSLGLQATGARRVSAAPEQLRSTEKAVVAASYRVAAALGLLTLLAAPLVSALLRLDSWTAALLLALGMVPTTLMGAYAGIFQGERRWRSLAMVYLGAGLGRLGGGVAGILVREDVVGAMAGVAVGNAVPALLGAWFLRHPARLAQTAGAARATTTKDDHRTVLGEMAHNSHALFAFFALSNADVVVARAVFDEQQAGLYAGGLILTKAVLFLPQFVVIVAFPAMVGAARRRMQNQALTVILGLGTATVVGAWVLAPWAVLFVGGEQYDALEDRMWAFALVGTLLAMIQLVVYGAVARQHRDAVLILWGGLVVIAVVGPLIASMAGLLVSVTIVDTAVLLGLVVVSHRHQHPADQVVVGQA